MSVRKSISLNDVVDPRSLSKSNLSYRPDAREGGVNSPVPPSTADFSLMHSGVSWSVGPSKKASQGRIASYTVREQSTLQYEFANYQAALEQSLKQESGTTNHVHFHQSAPRPSNM